MFRSVSIKNFRCFRDFNFESLERVNLIAGANGVGKTALLEALFLLLGGTNVSLVLQLSVMRGIGKLVKEAPAAIRDLFWSPLFHALDEQHAIELSGQTKEGEQHHVSIRVVEAPWAEVTLVGCRMLDYGWAFPWHGLL
jgi:predicted ATPase